MPSREAVHREPVWRSQSDFIIATSIDGADTDVVTEQLWAKRIDDRHFELCCIPFFAHDLALGDLVQVDSAYMVEQVAKPSGRYVFRAFFDSLMLRTQEKVVQGLSTLGALLEWSSQSLVAIDARDVEHANELAEYLAQCESRGLLLYETGKARTA
ncbi:MULTISPECIES: DUF4265 domain-containing protein [unclassified Leifsonia]|uniref:DUF4265 domain-containing protein n=1 Tax=unclassified Leifsonia TaxID=2663824 RepID=UPI000A91907D|nr:MULTISPECIES: DUF4265 domain-containing protein [unclassified Leifsonia]